MQVNPAANVKTVARLKSMVVVVVKGAGVVFADWLGDSGGGAEREGFANRSLLKPAGASRRPYR